MIICHLSSAHFRFDARIFNKQCKSSIAEGHKVFLIVADGLGNDVLNNIHIVDVGKSINRFTRVFYSSFLVFKAARKINADIYQFHDPEILLFALFLRNRKSKVIFDAHEDQVNTILLAHYLSPIIARFVSFIYAKFEKLICSNLDGIITATPEIEKMFIGVNDNLISVMNYPIIEDYSICSDQDNKLNEICYVGSISRHRGLFEVVQSLNLIDSDVKLNLVGKFSDRTFEKELKAIPAFENCKSLGYLSHDSVNEIYKRSVAGIVTVHPIPTYLRGIPIKLFEYMASSLPIIISDFDYWRELLLGCNCCVFVDPNNPDEIAKAIDYLFNDLENARQMGKNGRLMAEFKFNWKTESIKLQKFYNKIIID
jgi:glycosyltransferase involved in cell wall biosynthesis